MSESLRPLTLGEILDRTAQLYRRNFLLFAGVAAAPTAVLVPAFVAMGALIAFFGITSKPAITPNFLAVLLILALLLLVFPLVLAATVFSQAGLTRIAICAQLGQPITIRAALKTVRQRFWRYLWLLLLQGLLAAVIPMAIAFCLIVAGAILARLAGGVLGTAASGFFIFLVVVTAVVVIVVRILGYSFGMPICVAENKTAWDSLERSLHLTKGTRGRIAVMFLLVWALSILLSLVAYIPIVLVTAAVTAIGKGAAYATVTLVVAEILNFLINFALQTLLAPAYITAIVLFYYDQRIRTEGFDIEWMMQQAGLVESPATPEFPFPLRTVPLRTIPSPASALPPGTMPPDTMPPDTVKE